MSKTSAGILLYRGKPGNWKVFLVHPGGPYWKHKDKNAWSIPKGEIEAGEDLWQAALREFHEETGFHLPENIKAIGLPPVKQKGGKTVYAWAIQADVNPKKLKSNYFEMEWPPKSGQKVPFPEIDKGAWFDLETAYDKIITAQQHFLDALKEKMHTAKN